MLYIPTVCMRNISEMEADMSRNKYPEETHELILEVSAKLFIEKGYDKTSLQDIIDGLGGMTKGAIYHHFRSKEDILIAVVERMCEKNSDEMAQIRDDPSLNGKEKLEKMFADSLSNPRQEDVFSVTPNLIENPKLLSYYLKMVAYTVVPDYVVPIIQQAVQDGSIQTEYPQELADMIMFLTDVWMNPAVFPLSDEQLTNRILLINDLLKPLHIELISKEMIACMSDYRKIANRQNATERKK